MDHQYGIAVANKFNFLIDEDEDPLEIISKQEELTKSTKKDGDKKSAKSKGKKIPTPATEVKAKSTEAANTKKDVKREGK